jgi:hypothetical protein
MKTIIALLSLCFLWSPAFSQNNDSTQLTEMTKLSFLVGQWEGTGYFEYAPGQRRTFTETEDVQMKLGGLMLVFEGTGQSKAANGETITVHDALALARYDEQSHTFRWQAYRADRGALSTVESEAQVTNQTLEWGFQDNRAGKVRFTIKLDETGAWSETGESSSDGQNWHTFMVMTLKHG